MSTKPTYRGSFKGQVVSTGGAWKTRGVVYENKDGDRVFGAVQSKVEEFWVWNGMDWVIWAGNKSAKTPKKNNQK